VKSKLLLILFCIFLTVNSYGQNDSALVPAFLDVPDGIYLSYTDFRYNKAILKENIVSTGNKDQLDFIGKILEKEKFSFSKDQKSNTVETRFVWGFVQNKTLYINYKGSFYRVPVFGSICYLVATLEIIGVGFYDPMFGPGSGPSGRQQEVREFLINFYDGVITEFKMDQVELLLARDKGLYDEFKKLSNKKQKEQIFRYIRRYNEAHSVYFLK
jgi:hypothetical protein